MDEKEIKTVNGIRKAYEPKSIKRQKLDELIALDRKASRKAEVFAYIFGTLGALVLGVGMCFAMKVIGASISVMFPVGIVIGCVGIIMCAVNYFIYKALLKAGKEKYGAEILRLSDQLLNN